MLDSLLSASPSRASAPEPDDDAGGQPRRDHHVVTIRNYQQVGHQAKLQPAPNTHVQTNPWLHEEPGFTLFLENPPRSTW